MHFGTLVLICFLVGVWVGIWLRPALRRTRRLVRSGPDWSLRRAGIVAFTGIDQHLLSQAVVQEHSGSHQGQGPGSNQQGQHLLLLANELQERERQLQEWENLLDNREAVEKGLQLRQQQLDKLQDRLERSRIELEQEKQALEAERHELDRQQQKRGKAFAPFKKKLKQYKKKLSARLDTMKDGQEGHEQQTSDQGDSVASHRKGRGKPKGARGGGRKRPDDPDYYDERIDAVPDRCDAPGCQTAFDSNTATHGKYDRHVINVEKIRRGLVCTVKWYTVHRKVCPVCRKLVSGSSRVPTPKGAIFGYGYIAYVLMHRVKHRDILKTIIDQSSDIFGETETCSAQSIGNWLQRIHRVLQPVLDQLAGELKQNPWIKIDETGIPMEQGKAWMWVFCTSLVRIFVPSLSRSHKVPLELLGDYDGIVVSDFFRAYDKLPQEKARCHVHLYRAIMDIIEADLKTIARLAKKLVDDGQERERQQQVKEAEASGKPRPKRRGRPRKNPPALLTEAQIKRLEEQKARAETEAALAEELLVFLLTQDIQGWTVDQCHDYFTALKDRCSNSGLMPGSELLKIFQRIDKYWEELFRYKSHPSGTDIKENNLAEATVKEYAPLRRSHGTWRSLKIARAIAACLSVTVTWRLHQPGLQGFTLWVELVQGRLDPCKLRFTSKG